MSTISDFQRRLYPQTLEGLKEERDSVLTALSIGEEFDLDMPAHEEWLKDLNLLIRDHHRREIALLPPLPPFTTAEIAEIDAGYRVFD